MFFNRQNNLIYGAKSLFLWRILALFKKLCYNDRKIKIHCVLIGEKHAFQKKTLQAYDGGRNTFSARLYCHHQFHV